MYDLMPTLPLTTPPVAAPDALPRQALRKMNLRTLTEVPRVVKAVVDALAGAGYSAEERFAVRLALDEAVVNALKHGHGFDPKLEVRVQWALLPTGVWLDVTDEGPGFDPGAVPDPQEPENLERPCGRGLFLMSEYLTWYVHVGRGNRVIMFRERGRASPPDAHSASPASSRQAGPCSPTHLPPGPSVLPGRRNRWSAGRAGSLPG